MVFVGSWGRREVTNGSDNDFYVLVEDEPKRVGPAAIEAIKEVLREEEAEHRAATEFRAPGEDGTFGQSVSLQNLLKKIGRNPDNNDNLTHRMLLVLESTAIRNPHGHRQARAAIIGNYLEEPVKAAQPPRLFLNDVVRYWRTMCVDFAGKMRERNGQGWGLCNAKLRTTRKMLFASGLLPVLRCAGLASAEIAPFLLAQFELPPTDRVAAAFDALEQASAPAPSPPTSASCASSTTRRCGRSWTGSRAAPPPTPPRASRRWRRSETRSRTG